MGSMGTVFLKKVSSKGKTYKHIQISHRTERMFTVVGVKISWADSIHYTNIHQLHRSLAYCHVIARAQGWGCYSCSRVHLQHPHDKPWGTSEQNFRIEKTCGQKHKVSKHFHARLSPTLGPAVNGLSTGCLIEWFADPCPRIRWSDGLGLMICSSDDPLVWWSTNLMRRVQQYGLACQEGGELPGEAL